MANCLAGLRLGSGRSGVRITRWRWEFSGSSHTSDLKIGTPVATLPGAWHYRVSAGTGRPGASILVLGKVESWICNFYLSVTARNIVWADPSLRYTSMMLGRWTTNQQTPVAILPGAWRYRVSVGTGRSGVSILWLGEIVWSATSISVWQHVLLSELDPSLWYTCMLMGR